MMMEITQITDHKKRYLNLLLLADEQEDMVDRYLDRGDMFLLTDTDAQAPITVAVVTEEASGTCELKNIATAPAFQHKGYGSRMVAFLFAHYQGRYHTMLVGTGDAPGILGFYKGCGFVLSHRIPHFFTKHYDHPIIDEGVLLDDMVYLKKEL